MDRVQMISILRGRIEIYRRLAQTAADKAAAESRRRFLEEDERDLRALETFGSPRSGGLH